MVRFKHKKNKTYINIFGKDIPELPFVKELGLNFYTKFTLLGITCDSTLSFMLFNFDEGLRKLEIVANDWWHKYLTICGKIKVVKTFMFSVSVMLLLFSSHHPKFAVKSFKKLGLILLRVNENHLKLMTQQN